jgi:hypothetical protein
MSLAESIVHRPAGIWIESRQGAAANQIARLSFLGIERNTPPQEAESRRIAVTFVNAGAANLDHPTAQGLEHGEIEFLL